MTVAAWPDKRLSRLDELDEQVMTASAGLLRLRGLPRNLRIRPQFAMLAEPAPRNGELADRLVPPRSDRPPATRLVSPRGIALRLYLTALFVAQSRAPGAMPGNTLPLANIDAPVSWIDLIATTAHRHGGRKHAREMKLRQVHEALRRLADPGLQLVSLPNLPAAPAGRYEGFTLLHEGGAPAGTANVPYTVPGPQVTTMYLPGGLFSNGWIQVLQDSELAFLLMLACLRSRSDAPRVFATSEVRLLQFGLGRDAYGSHRLLAELGLVTVHPGPHPGRRYGKAGRYLRSDPPKPHRFELRNEGFGQPALPALREVLTRLAAGPA